MKLPSRLLKFRIYLVLVLVCDWVVGCLTSECSCSVLVVFCCWDLMLLLVDSPPWFASLLVTLLCYLRAHYGFSHRSVGHIVVHVIVMLVSFDLCCLCLCWCPLLWIWAWLWTRLILVFYKCYCWRHVCQFHSKMLVVLIFVFWFGVVGVVVLFLVLVSVHRVLIFVGDEHGVF